MESKMRSMHPTPRKITVTKPNKNTDNPSANISRPHAPGGLKRVLLGLALAVGLVSLGHEASAGTSVLHVLFKATMVNSGVDTNAQGQIDGSLNRQGNTSNQRLKIALSNLDPTTDYQLLAFIGDEGTLHAAPRNRTFPPPVRVFQSANNRPHKCTCRRCPRARASSANPCGRPRS